MKRTTMIRVVTGSDHTASVMVLAPECTLEPAEVKRTHFFVGLTYMPVCVFDLDQTLTCGQARRAIHRCRQLGFDLAINTARPQPWLDDRLQGLGLPLPGSPAFVHNPHSYQQTSAQRAAFKGRAMHRLARHFGTDQLVLFDDLPDNVAAAERAGYRGQLVSHNGTCGISEDDLTVLGDMRQLCWHQR